jgi:hypothetical protein
MFPYQTHRSRLSLALVAAALIALTAPASAGSVVKEPKSIKERLVGTWIFISSINTRKDGSTYDRWGPNPKGVLMFDASGRYSQIITRSETALFGPKTIFSFGTFTVDEVDTMIVTHIEGASVPKLNGTQQRRKIKLLNGDELRYVNLDGLSGAMIDAIWKRAPLPQPHSASLIRPR